MVTSVPRAARVAARPRLGFLGVGWIGLNRLQGIAAAGGADIVAVADLAPDLVAAARRAVPQARAAAGLEELLALDLDGVVIATPSALHAEQAALALERGLAVFCQKPLGRDAAETRRVVAAARAADRLLAVDFSYRHVRGVQRMHELMGEGAIGTVYAADLVFHNAYGPDKPWFYDPRQAGGGCVLDLGIHLVDLVLWLTRARGVVRTTSRLYAKGAPLPDPRTAVEDYAAATLELDGGAVATLACSWHLPAGVPAVIQATLYGTEGALALRNVNGSFYDFCTTRMRGTTTEVLDEEGEGWGQRAAVAFAAALARSAAYDPAIEEVVAVAEAVDAIYGR
ncbi:MAG TPA: Gfo/Idh/MocA family oxidoreductase [Polyangia bacterium]